MVKIVTFPEMGSNYSCKNVTKNLGSAESFFYRAAHYNLL